MRQVYHDFKARDEGIDRLFKACKDNEQWFEKIAAMAGSEKEKLLQETEDETHKTEEEQYTEAYANLQKTNDFKPSEKANQAINKWKGFNKKKGDQESTAAEQPTELEQTASASKPTATTTTSSTSVDTWAKRVGSK